MKMQFNKSDSLKRIYNNFLLSLPNLNSGQIQQYFNAARLGVNFYKASFFEEVKRRDARIGSLVFARKFGAIGKWCVEYEDENKKADQTVLEFVNNSFKNVDMYNLFSDIIESQITGVRTFYLDFDHLKYPGKWMLKDVVVVPSWLLCYDQASDSLKILDANKADYTLSMSLSLGIMNNDVLRVPVQDIAEETLFSCYGLDGDDRNPFLNGVVDLCCYMYFFKSHGLKDWACFVESFATPGVIATYDTDLNTEDKRALNDAIYNFGQLFRAVVPQGTDIKTLDVADKAQSSDVFERFVKDIKDELSIRIIGQAMTTDASSGGSYAKAKVGDSIRKDIVTLDQIFITSTINKLIRKIVDLNFEGVKIYPQFRFEAEPDVDYNIKVADLSLKKAEVILKLKEAGVSIPDEMLDEMFPGASWQTDVTTSDQPPINNKESSTSTKKFVEVGDISLEQWVNQIIND